MFSSFIIARIKSSIWVILSFWITSCIDKYNFTSEEPQRFLNVEGNITTIPKEHRIRLSRLEKFGPEFIGLGRPVTLATVLIKDDLGGVENLIETGSGYYVTSPDFAAVVGRSYNLES